MIFVQLAICFFFFFLPEVCIAVSAENNVAQLIQVILSYVLRLISRDVGAVSLYVCRPSSYLQCCAPASFSID